MGKWVSPVWYYEDYNMHACRQLNFYWVDQGGTTQTHGPGAYVLYVGPKILDAEPSQWWVWFAEHLPTCQIANGACAEKCLEDNLDLLSDSQKAQYNSWKTLKDQMSSKLMYSDGTLGKELNCDACPKDTYEYERDHGKKCCWKGCIDNDKDSSCSIVDCDDNPLDDPAVCWTFDNQVYAKTLENYQLIKNRIDCSGRQSICAKCVNPGATELCGDIDSNGNPFDNNCNNLANCQDRENCLKKPCLWKDAEWKIYPYAEEGTSEIGFCLDILALPQIRKSGIFIGEGPFYDYNSPPKSYVAQCIQNSAPRIGSLIGFPINLGPIFLGEDTTFEYIPEPKGSLITELYDPNYKFGLKPPKGVVIRDEEAVSNLDCGFITNDLTGQKMEIAGKCSYFSWTPNFALEEPSEEGLEAVGDGILYKDNLPVSLPNVLYPGYSLAFQTQDSGVVSSIGQEDKMWQDQLWLWKQRNMDFISQNPIASSDAFLNYQKQYLQSQESQSQNKIGTIYPVETTLCPSELKPSAETAFGLNLIGFVSWFILKDTDPDLGFSAEFDSEMARFYKVYDLGPEDFEGLSKWEKTQLNQKNFKEKLGCGLPIEFKMKLTSAHIYVNNKKIHEIREKFQGAITPEIEMLIEASGQNRKDFFVPEKEFFNIIDSIDKAGAEPPFAVYEEISISIAREYNGKITVEAIDKISVKSNDGKEYSSDNNGAAQVLFEDPLVGLFLYNEIYIKSLKKAKDFDVDLKKKMEEIKEDVYKNIIPVIPPATIELEETFFRSDEDIQSTLDSLKMCCGKDIGAELEKEAFCNPDFKISSLSGNLGAKINAEKVNLPYDKLLQIPLFNFFIDKEVGYKFNIGTAPCEVVLIEGEKVVECNLYPEDEDAYASVDISIDGINWPVPVTEENKISCGSPDKLKLDFKIGGIYYNRYDFWPVKIPFTKDSYWNIPIGLLNRNIFLEGREKALEMIDSMPINLKNVEWKDSQGNQISSPILKNELEDFFKISEEEKAKGDKNADEKLSLTLEKAINGIKVTIEDTITFDGKTLSKTSSGNLKLREEPLPGKMIEMIFKEAIIKASKGLSGETYEKIKSGYEENLYIELPIELIFHIADLLVIIPINISEKGTSNMKEIKGYSWNAVECCKTKEELQRTDNKITTKSPGESVYMLRDSANFNEQGIAYQINFNKETDSIIEKTFNKPGVLFGNWENYEIYKYPDEYIDLFCKYEVLEEKTFSINHDSGTYALDSFEVSVPENAFDSAKLTIKKLVLVSCDKENVFTEDYQETSNLDFLFQSLKAFMKGDISLKKVLEIIRELVRS